MKTRSLLFSSCCGCALLCCWCSLLLLLLASSSSSSSSAGALPLLPQGGAAAAAAAKTTTAATSSSLTSSSSSPSATTSARKLLASSSSSHGGRHSRRGTDEANERDEAEERRGRFSVVDTSLPSFNNDNKDGDKNKRSRRSSSRRSRGNPLPSLSLSLSSPTPPPPLPTIDLYVRTYRGDAAWLTWLLRSVEANVEPSAFRQLLVSVARNDSELFGSFLPLFSGKLPIVMLVSDDAPFARATRVMGSVTADGGYHAQMFDKLTRPPLFSDADFFVHVDSDCVFKRQLVEGEGEGKEEGGKEGGGNGNAKEKKTKNNKKLPPSSSSSSSSSSSYRKITRSDFVDPRGRVRARRVPFASLPEPFHRWQKAAEGMLLEKVPFETMSCFPLVFPRRVYGLVKEIVLERHGERAMKREQEEEGGSGGNNSSGGGGVPSPLPLPPPPLSKDASLSLFHRILSHHLDDFGEFTALGHVLTTRLKEGEAWVSDFGEGEGEGDGDGGEVGVGKGGRGRERNTSPLLPPPLVSTPTSSSPKSFCSLTQQAWSWGSVTPEAAVEAERSLRVGW